MREFDAMPLLDRRKVEDRLSRTNRGSTLSGAVGRGRIRLFATRSSRHAPTHSGVCRRSASSPLSARSMIYGAGRGSSRADLRLLGQAGSTKAGFTAFWSWSFATI